MARRNLHYYLILVLLIFCYTGFSEAIGPVSIDSVNFKRIEHKKIRKLISMQKDFGVKTFDEIHPACYNVPDSLDFRTFEKSQLIRQDEDVVWQHLVHQSPNDEFDGRIVTFGLLYSKKNHTLMYHNDSSTGIEEGQLLFFNLRLLRGIKNLAVALEVTRVDNENKEFEYCYVDHGDTKGTQKFSLRPTPDGFTELTQVTKYHCKSRLRDRRLYSFFHEQIVKEFFTAIKKKCESGKESIAVGL